MAAIVSLAAFYVIFAGGGFLGGMWWWAANRGIDANDARKGARIALVALVWPFALPVLTALMIRDACRKDT